MLVALGEPDGRRSWPVTVDDGRVVAVFVLDDGSWCVTDGICPHNGGRLADGLVRAAGDGAPDPTVTCPAHWYRFSLATGRCLTMPCDGLRLYEVVDRDGVRYAELPPLAPAPSWSETLRAHARGDD